MAEKLNPMIINVPCTTCYATTCIKVTPIRTNDGRIGIWSSVDCDYCNKTITFAICT